MRSADSVRRAGLYTFHNYGVGDFIFVPGFDGIMFFKHFGQVGDGLAEPLLKAAFSEILPHLFCHLEPAIAQYLGVNPLIPYYGKQAVLASYEEQHAASILGLG